MVKMSDKETHCPGPSRVAVDGVMAIPADREPMGLIIQHGVIAPRLVVNVRCLACVEVAGVATQAKGVGGKEHGTGLGVMTQLARPAFAHPLEGCALQWASPFHDA
jgi:hypothetical protein